MTEGRASCSVGLVGARGYVGAEMLRLLDGHPHLHCAFAASRSRAGHPVADPHDRGLSSHAHSLRYEHLQPAEAAQRGVDALVLCLADGEAARWAAAFDDETLVLDISGDHRFDDGWIYGLSEHRRAELAHARRISNPGCYATAAQLALRPLRYMLADAPHCFGVSGYSGAGRTPNARNDAGQLADGITPYSLAGHRHEREMRHHLGMAVRFGPAVAPFERGIVMTVQARLRTPTSAGELCARYLAATGGDALVQITAQMPRVQQIRHRDGAIIGGFAANPERADEVALVCVLDNLRKGAAGQALQNLNLALGFDECAGLHPPEPEKGATV